MYLAYTYYISNKITNQFYYGSRFGNIRMNRTPLDDLWIYYFTSSKYVKNLMVKFGKDSFEFKIILEDFDYNKCYWAEQDLIKNNINDELCLNKHFIDKTTNCKVFSTAGQPCTEETKKKISKSNTGRKQTSESCIKKSKATKGISRNKFTEEHKKNMSLARIGKPTGRKGTISSLKGKSYTEIHGKDRADELKLLRANGRKDKNGRQNIGKDNPNAKSITINGIHYNTIKDACSSLNLTYYALSKIL